MLESNKKYIFFIGLLAILIIYSLYNIYFDLTSVPGISGKWKHANKFLFVLIIYGIGTFALKKYAVVWMMQVWHLIYAIFILALLLIGCYDWLHESITNQIRNIANSIFEFLISPVLYVCIGILYFRLFKKHQS